MKTAMLKPGTLVALVVCLLAMGPAAQAAEMCQPEDTVGSCWDRIRQEVAPEPEASAEETVQETEAEEEQDLEEQPTGQDTSGTTLQATTKSFLPLLAFAGLFGQGDVVDDQGDLIADLNFLLPGGLGGKNSQLQAITATEPALSSVVRDALPEASRDELAGQLEDQLSAGDDLVISFTYNMEGLKRGRDFEIYRGRYQALVQPFVLEMEDQQRQSGPALAAALNEVRCTGADDLEDVTFEEIKESETCGGDQAERVAKALAARRSVAAAAQAFYSNLRTLREKLVEAGLDRFGELVANQPQLHLSIKRNEREALVGPNATSGKLTFEWSRTNLNQALRSDECHQDLELSAETADRDLVKRCLAQYKGFMAKHGKEVTEGERFSFSLEYESNDTLEVPLAALLPDSELTDLRIPGSKKRIAALGWSRNFVGLQDQPTRFDIVARYEDVSDDPTRRDRLVATATFELKVGQLDVPLGVVYANHGEFLGEVDEQLSAHLGLRFKLKGIGGEE